MRAQMNLLRHSSRSYGETTPWMTFENIWPQKIWDLVLQNSLRMTSRTGKSILDPAALQMSHQLVAELSRLGTYLIRLWKIWVTRTNFLTDDVWLYLSASFLFLRHATRQSFGDVSWHSVLFASVTIPCVACA